MDNLTEQIVKLQNIVNNIEVYDEESEKLCAKILDVISALRVIEKENKQ